MTLGRTKCIEKSRKREHTRTAIFRILRPYYDNSRSVGSWESYWTACGVPGIEDKYRKRGNGKFETSSYFLPRPNYLHMWSISGVETDIFYCWSSGFIKKTKHHRRDGHKLSISDGWICLEYCIQYPTFIGRKWNRCRLAPCTHVPCPATASPCNIWPLEQEFCPLLSVWTITTAMDDRNDIVTVCELLKHAYYACLIGQNSISGFRQTGIWFKDLQGLDISKIRETDWRSQYVSTETTESLLSKRYVISIADN